MKKLSIITPVFNEKETVEEINFILKIVPGNWI